MMFYSVLFPNEESAALPRRTKMPDSFRDLQLDLIVKQALGENQNLGLEEYFYTPVSDPAVIRYRQGVLRELEDLCDRLALLHKGALVLEGDLYALRGGLFKIRTAFKGYYDESRFEGIDLLAYEQQGSVCTLTTQGDREAVTARIRGMDPLLLETASLTLEEVFTLKMKQLGYDFSEGGEA